MIRDSFVEVNDAKLLLSKNINLNSLTKVNTSIFEGNKLKMSISQRMSNAIKNIADPVLRKKLHRTLLTTSTNEIRELLSDVMIMSIINSGKEPTEKILFPLLYEYYNNPDFNKKEREEMVKNLRNDYIKCKEICLNDFDLQRQATAKTGIDYFYMNINNVIKPYKLF